jgi:general stress protein 26
MDRSKKHQSDVALLQEKIKDIRVVMLTTLEPDGSLHGRPMIAQENEFDGTLWFFTASGAPKVGEVQRHQQVCLNYTKPDGTLYVSVSGSAQLLSDRKKIKELWRPIHKTWFSNGEDDPNLALLKVHVERAEYWEWPSGKNGLLYSVVKGVMGQQERGGIDVKMNWQG